MIPYFNKDQISKWSSALPKLQLQLDRKEYNHDVDYMISEVKKFWSTEVPLRCYDDDDKLNVKETFEMTVESLQKCLHESMIKPNRWKHSRIEKTKILLENLRAKIEELSKRT